MLFEAKSFFMKNNQSAALMQELAALPQGDTFDPQQAFKDSQFNYLEQPIEPSYMMRLNGIGIMPRGGITAITGNAKCGKTHFLAALVAVAMSGKPFGSLSRGEAPRRILWIDTEQAPFNLYSVIRRVFKAANIDPQAGSDYGLEVLRLRPYSPQQRVDIINVALQQLNPDLLIIDGCRDLVNDFNSVLEATAFSTWLLGVLETHPDMAIATVLHTNPDSERMRGNLGTELLNKMQDRFDCAKSNETFVVKHNSRGKVCTVPFVFHIDDAGNLATATIEQAAGVMDAEQALIAAVPDDGEIFGKIVGSYAKLTGMKKVDATAAIKRRIDIGDLVKNRDTGRFYRRT